MRTSVYSTHLNVNFTTSQLFPRPTLNNFQFAVRWLLKKTPYNYTVPPSSSSCVFIFLSLPTSFFPARKKSNPQKKHPPPQLLTLPPLFFDVPFRHLLVLPLLQAPFPPRATASPPPRGRQQWLELTRFRRPTEASWLRASLGSRSSRGKMRLALKSEGLSMYSESTK